MVTEADEPQPEDTNAFHALSSVLLRRYLLRELLWCQPCDQPKVPILIGRLSRYYACTNKQCPHPALPAGITEQRVWSRFVRQQGTVARGVPRERRHDMLRGALKRVVVGGNMTDLRLEWRE